MRVTFCRHTCVILYVRHFYYLSLLRVHNHNICAYMIIERVRIYVNSMTIT